MINLKLTKEISYDQQKQFASLSGDFNPIHLNPNTARRELFGEIVVHGMHLILSALDSFVMQNKIQKHIIIDSLNVKFFSPALVSKPLIFIFNFDEKLIKVEIRDTKKAILSEMLIAYHSEQLTSKNIINKSFKVSQPDNINIKSSIGLKGDFLLFLDKKLKNSLFPSLHILADIQIAEILVMTRIVGMKCPGKQSLFTGVNVVFEKSDNKLVRYFSKSIVEKFSMATIGFEGPTLNGQLSTFFRPESTNQPNIEQVSENIPKNIFKGVNALIIGGSRGIGETTAKIIAAGGGESVITYNLGKDDAENVCEEINNAGFTSQCFKLDIENFDKSLEEKILKFGFDVVFYYPSPKILASKIFDSQLFNNFLYYYVEQFENLIRQIRLTTVKKIIVFYPSTINIEEKTPGFTEYIMSKMAGEYLCDTLTREFENINILVERLPRLQTDQTMNLQNKIADSTLDVMLPIILRINELISSLKKSNKNNK